MKKKNWIIAETDTASSRILETELRIPHLASRVLAARGIRTRDQAEQYFDCDVCHMHDPMLMKDMDKAVAEIERAISAGERIAVYGDYDVDGVTSTCILIKYLRSRNADCIYYIPDRINEGYGLNAAAIKCLYDQGSRLVITVDSGITAIEEAEYARQLGMRLIITDHHECKDEYPDAVAVVNPRRPDGDYPFRELAGVGVAFKLICALEGPGSTERMLDRFSDIVAVGTIADVMPLVGENKIIVSRGLKALSKTTDLGLRALMQKLGLDSRTITSNNVSFIMAPRINAAGRMGAASRAARLFLTEDHAEAAALAEELCELNRLRQQEENKIYTQIVTSLENHSELTQKSILIMWGQEWHNGVVGIVASRISDRYGVPCILISLSDGMGKGSGRSVKNFNLHAALTANSEYIEKFGGHELAVGLTVAEENLEAFRSQMEEWTSSIFDENEMAYTIAVDCMVEPSELTINEVGGLRVMEPFGMGNQQPGFMMENMTVEEVTPISRDKHVRLTLSRNGYVFQALIFGMGARHCPYVRGDTIDIVFSAEINSFRGTESVQFIIKDTRRTADQIKCDERDTELYARFCRGEEISKCEALYMSPSRDDLVAVFRYIRSKMKDGILAGSVQSLYRKIRYESRESMNLSRFLICVSVFDEFNIFSCKEYKDEISIHQTDFTGKANINGSKILKKLMDIIKG